MPRAIAATPYDGRMFRWLIVIFLALILISWFTPLLRKLGVGKLPGDFRFRLFGREWFIPLSSTLVLSMVAALISRYLGAQGFRVSELHDGLGQNLLIIKNWAAICLDKISANSKVKQEIIDISDCATNALQEMRSITRNLRPQSLAVEGLTKTLNLMSKQIETVFKIKFQNEIDGVDNLFSEEEELSIYRIVQESLNNLVKHSGAKNAQIKVKRTNLNFIEKIEISIIDDGKGFNRTSLKKTGLGLVNIAQRTELLGGTLKIYSSPDKGTTVSVILNVEPKIYRQNKAPKSAETFQNSKISSFE